MRALLLLCLLSVPVHAVAQTAAVSADAEPAVVPAMLDAINEARAEGRDCGDEAFTATAPLSWNEDLADAALAHSTDMATEGFRGHEGSDGSRARDRVTDRTDAFGPVSETIAFHFRTPEEALLQWLNSPPHCRIIMRESLTHVGAAVAVGPSYSNPDLLGIYWTATFGEAIVGTGIRPHPQLTAAQSAVLADLPLTVYGRPNDGVTQRLVDALRAAGVEADPRDVRVTTHASEVRTLYTNAGLSEYLPWPAVRAGDQLVGGVTSVAELVEAIETDAIPVVPIGALWLARQRILIYGHASSVRTQRLMRSLTMAEVPFRMVDVEIDRSARRKMWRKVHTADIQDTRPYRSGERDYIALPVVDVGGRLVVGVASMPDLLEAVGQGR